VGILCSGRRDVPITFDSEESPDDVEPDSDDDVKSTHEKGYDSDKDPAWRPNVATQVTMFTYHQYVFYLITFV